MSFYLKKIQRKSKITPLLLERDLDLLRYLVLLLPVPTVTYLLSVMNEEMNEATSNNIFQEMNDGGRVGKEVDGWSWVSWSKYVHSRGKVGKINPTPQ